MWSVPAAGAWTTTTIVRAGLNLYHLGEDGSLARAEAWVIDPDSLELVEKPLRGAP